ncbi:thermonuclease family protein [Candidatus Daviesbacteria bacterium]|nr:thermonuclease family protein [Candidatus Daviesbacteria bacterium]
MKNQQIKLLVLSILTLGLSSYFFYQGLVASPNLVQKQPSQNLAQLPSSSSVLGSSSSANLANLEQVKVTRVIDGDTIEVEINGELKKLRYIGVNTPETVDPRRPVQCFGKEASAENKRLLEEKSVYLEKDISETDKYGRLLRYVYLPLSDGSVVFINDYLVRQGFAYASTFPPDVKYQDKFLVSQKEASDNLRGLWLKCK